MAKLINKNFNVEFNYPWRILALCLAISRPYPTGAFKFHRGIREK
jgi:hypothetical protein